MHVLYSCIQLFTNPGWHSGRVIVLQGSTQGIQLNHPSVIGRSLQRHTARHAMRGRAHCWRLQRLCAWACVLNHDTQILTQQNGTLAGSVSGVKLAFFAVLPSRQTVVSQVCSSSRTADEPGQCHMGQ